MRVGTQRLCTIALYLAACEHTSRRVFMGQKKQLQHRSIARHTLTHETACGHKIRDNGKLFWLQSSIRTVSQG